MNNNERLVAENFYHCICLIHSFIVINRDSIPGKIFNVTNNPSDCAFKSGRINYPPVVSFYVQYCFLHIFDRLLYTGLFNNLHFFFHDRLLQSWKLCCE